MGTSTVDHGSLKAGVRLSLVGFCSFSLLVVGGLAYLVFGVRPCFPVFFAWSDLNLKAGRKGASDNLDVKKSV